VSDTVFQTYKRLFYRMPQFTTVILRNTVSDTYRIIDEQESCLLTWRRRLQDLCYKWNFFN